MPNNIDKAARSADPLGFTIVEIMVAVTISLVLVGAIVSFTLGITDQFAINTVRGQMNTQAMGAINRLSNDASYAHYVLASNSVTDGSAPSGDGQWNSGTQQLVLGVTARDSGNNPLSDDPTTDFDNYIYYLNGGTIFRRVLAFPDANNRYATVNCPQTIGGGCDSGDSIILHNVESFNLIYYDAEGSETADYATAVSFKVSVKLKVSQSKQQVSITRSAVFKVHDKFSAASDPEPEPTSLNCFQLDNGGTRVRDYYYYEHNNSANTPCPRDVVIPPAITNIFNSSMMAKQLTSVTFLNKGQSINVDPYAFRKNKLTSLTIPPSVSSIGIESFWDNQISSLTVLDRPVPIAIGAGAFRSNKLTSLTIPPSVSSIGVESFWDNQISSLTVLDRPVPIEISTGAFRSNNFTSVTIPPSVSRVAPDAFFSNGSLTHALVANSTTLTSTSFPPGTIVTRY